MVGTVVVHSEGEAPESEGEAETDFAYGEPREATIDEVGRHPSDMPEDTEWARYENGTYTGQVDRSGDGDVEHEVHMSIEECTVEMLDDTTMDVWTFDGKVPGPMVRVQEGTT